MPTGTETFQGWLSCLARGWCWLPVVASLISFPLPSIQGASTLAQALTECLRLYQLLIPY